jgi:SAM-dependent methyltransferase
MVCGSIQKRPNVGQSNYLPVAERQTAPSAPRTVVPDFYDAAFLHGLSYSIRDNCPMKVTEDFISRSKLRDIGRWYVTQFVREVAADLPQGTRILDAGAGECAYKGLFTQHQYVAVDAAVGDAAWNYRNVDVVGVIHQLPFADDSFEAVLCTQTLEHVERPCESVADLYRVLKPGGRLFLTAPFTHPEHQLPHDYFRYTSSALRSICARAGFGEINVAPFGGMFTRMAYELPSILSIFPSAGTRTRQWKLRGVVWLPLKAVLLVLIRMAQCLLLPVDRFDKARNYPFGWRVTARKC